MCAAAPQKEEVKEWQLSCGWQEELRHAESDDRWRLGPRDSRVRVRVKGGGMPQPQSLG